MKALTFKTACYALIFIFFNFRVFAEDIVVTALKAPSLKQETAASIIILDEKEINESGAKNLFELLENYSQFQVNQSGPGGTVSVQLKGSESSHLLVVLDGLILNDPINTNALFDFNQLTLEGIEKIEILPGSQSVIFGSQAIGGVINLISKSKEGPQIFKAGFGSYRNTQISNHLYQNFWKTDLNFGFSYEISDGYNATTKTNSNPAEKDGFNKQNFSLVLRNKKNPYGDFQFSARYHRIKNDLDKGFGNERDDSNYGTLDNFYFFSLKVKPYTGISSSDTELFVGVSKGHRNTVDEPDALSTSRDTQLYRSKTIQGKAHHIFHLPKKDHLLLGADFVRESGSFDLSFSGSPTTFQDKEEDRIGGYLHYQKHWTEIFTLNTGVRGEFYRQKFHGVYKIGPSLYFKESDVKLYGLHSTGFKSPSLYQLYSQYGNRDLTAEKSLHFELGVEKKWKDSAHHFSIFSTKVEDFIDLEGTYPNQQYANVGETLIKGAELASRFSFPQQGLDYNLSLQYLDTLNEKTNQPLINRPELKFSESLSWAYKTRKIFLKHLYISQRISGTSTSPITLGGHSLFGMEYVHDFTTKGQFKFSLDNIFDKDYQHIAGFNTGGRQWKTQYLLNY